MTARLLKIGELCQKKHWHGRFSFMLYDSMESRSFLEYTRPRVWVDSRNEVFVVVGKITQAKLKCYILLCRDQLVLTSEREAFKLLK